MSSEKAIRELVESHGHKYIKQIAVEEKLREEDVSILDELGDEAE